MNPVITFFFILILAMYLYGYYMYYMKGKNKYIPKCNVIYVLDDGLTDDHRPDFTRSSQESNYLLQEKENIKIKDVKDEKENKKKMKKITKETQELLRVNDFTPIWCRNANDITNTEYCDFYKNISPL